MANRTEGKLEPAIFDSNASVKMFKHPKEATERSHRQGSSDIVMLAAGSTLSKSFETCTLPESDVKLQNSVYVDIFNEILVAVGHIFGQDKIVDFINCETVILNIKGFNVS